MSPGTAAARPAGERNGLEAAVAADATVNPEVADRTPCRARAVLVARVNCGLNQRKPWEPADISLERDRLPFGVADCIGYGVDSVRIVLTGSSQVAPMWLADAVQEFLDAGIWVVVEGGSAPTVADIASGGRLRSRLFG